jgi:Mrp family chromosome partitioning ATPase
VNNYQSLTFKSSLAGAAFISSRGEVYRLFQEGDDPTLGNDDFILNEFDAADQFDSNDSEPADVTIADKSTSIDSDVKTESKVESAIQSKIESDNNNRDNNFKDNYDSQADNLSDQVSDKLQLFDPLKRRGGDNLDITYDENEIDEIKENSDTLSDAVTCADSIRRFRVIRDDCETAVAELLALEVPKAIINVPEHVPPQEIPFDEQIRRIRGVTGICGKFQPTIHEKIIGNIDVSNDNILKSDIFVTKNQSAAAKVVSYSKETAKNQKIKSSAVGYAKPESKDLKLSFSPLRDKTAMEISEIIRVNKIPILDFTPDFFNSTPKTIPFTPNQKIIRNENSDDEKITSSENVNSESSRNIVTKNNNAANNNAADNIDNDNNDNDNDCNIDDNILPFPRSGIAGIAAKICGLDESAKLTESAENTDVSNNDKIKFGRLLLRRKLNGYELPNRIENLICKADEQISDLGDRFIDFSNAGQRVIGINGCFAGDGCSLISAFTAIELSSRGKRILLIDANKQNPNLSDFLEIKDNSKYEIVTLTNNFDFMSIFDKNIKIASNNIFRNDNRYSSNAKNYQDILSDCGDKLFRFICDTSYGYDFILFDAGCIADIPFGECANNWKTMCVNGIFLVASKNNVQIVDFNNIAKRLSDHKIELLGIMINTGV